MGTKKKSVPGVVGTLVEQHESKNFHSLRIYEVGEQVHISPDAQQKVS